MNTKMTQLWPVIGLLVAMSGKADQIIADDLIVEGAACVGVDCVNGESFVGDELKLKENNTRVRMVDKSLPDGLGNSWNIEANDSANGGNSYFDFQVKQSRNESPFVLPQQENVFPETLCQSVGQIFEDAIYDPTSRSFPELLTGNSIPIGGRTLGVQPLENPVCRFSGGAIVCDPTDAICVDVSAPVTEPAVVRARMEGTVPKTLCQSAGQVFENAVYDFSSGIFPDLLTGGSIPVGEDLLRLEPALGLGFCPGNVCDAICVQPDVAVVRSVLNLGTADNADAVFGEGVALGYESALVKGVVSVGRADLERRIAHVASGLGAMDALTVADLNGLSQQLASFNTELDDIERRIVIVEGFSKLADTTSNVGPGRSFHSKVTEAEAAYLLGDPVSACNILDALQNQIAAQAGKKLAAELAAELNAEVQELQSRIGCT